MCQAKIFLDGQEIMRDVILVEPTNNSVRLVAMFEPVREITAKINKIDLLKNQIILETIKEIEKT
jgi:predicted RNA-binding protein